MSRALHEKPELTNARADFYGRMAEQKMTPLWEVLHTLLAEAPVTDAVPHKWDYDLCRPYIMESADIISAEYIAGIHPAFCRQHILRGIR